LGVGIEWSWRQSCGDAGYAWNVSASSLFRTTAWKRRERSAPTFSSRNASSSRSKSVERRARAHAKQLLTYLRLSNLQVGLLLNFGCETMKEGIERVVNN